MYFGGISIFGIPGPLTGPISTLAGTYPSLKRYEALILCKKARPVRFGALAEFPRELVYFQEIGICIFGVGLVYKYVTHLFCKQVLYVLVYKLNGW